MTMTSSFPALRRALALFADLDWPVADRLLHRMADEPGKAAAMRRELDLAVGDPATNWPELVSNDSYEVTGADDPAAKDLVLDFLWDALHPSEPPRNLNPSNYRAYSHGVPPDSGSLSYDFTAGADIDVHIEDVSRDRELARVTHIKRVGVYVIQSYLSQRPAEAHLNTVLVACESLWRATRAKCRFT